MLNLLTAHRKERKASFIFSLLRDISKMIIIDWIIIAAYFMSLINLVIF